MKRYLMLLSCAVLMTVSHVAQADWFSKIAGLIKSANAIYGGILNAELASLDVQRSILATQKDIEHLMKQMNGNMTGHSGWGTYGFQDHQSYGKGANDWSSVMQMAAQGRGQGQLGEMIGSMSQQFPAQTYAFNQGVTNKHIQEHYALKSQTVLAARAASQLDYNRIQEQIGYQQMLQQQIEKTNDLKGAVDLSNRIQVENNLINLEVLRQVALTNQQQAVTEQASLSSALANAKFLTKK